MRLRVFLGLATLTLLSQDLYALKKNTFDHQINEALRSHFLAYHEKEYFSGMAMSIYLPDQAIKNYYFGQSGHTQESRPIDASSLFEIGSITKSFTGAIVLQLQKENRLDLDTPIKAWLNDYPKWSALSIRSLLNMTSGLPNYSDSPLFNVDLDRNPEKKWLNQELIQYAYPPASFSPPLKTGYFYSNTGYILVAMIIEKLTQHDFKTELENRLLKPAKLKNTFYPCPERDKGVRSRLVQGYGYNPYDNPEILGQDLSQTSLCWAGAAGALVSNSQDIIEWVKAIFIDTVLLDQNQKAEMMKIISTATGKSIRITNSKDRQGFGLGLAQAYDKDLGVFWFYEGQTEGFRALYLYSPKTGIIISSIFNSAVNAQNDHAGEFMKKIYSLVRKSNLKSHQ